MSSTAYTPRAGTKTATAAEALKQGPMNTVQLGKLLDVSHGAVSANLKPALEAGLIVRVKDTSGLLHFALASNAPEDGFTSNGKAEPVAKPTFNPADPFGLVGKPRTAAAQPAEAVEAPPPQKKHDLRHRRPRAPYRPRSLGRRRRLRPASTMLSPHRCPSAACKSSYGAPGIWSCLPTTTPSICSPSKPKHCAYSLN